MADLEKDLQDKIELEIDKIERVEDDTKDDTSDVRLTVDFIQALRKIKVLKDSLFSQTGIDYTQTIKDYLEFK